MGVEIVTDKYSTAIFELASETNTMDQLETDLAYVGEVFASQPQLRTLLLYPTLDANAKCDTLNKIAPLILFVLTQFSGISNYFFCLAAFLFSFLHFSATIDPKQR